ncbi:gamma glutamylcysteine synthetase [Punctularia strigosozonata HHB-11173 SS5]|uniref:Glutamate--cysteine ligase n=1 Tax=Punctularia strigosozonata (strain HHB-11173) TaxID=741275 RepID=R7S116_PUNST|nr:gamma glutamylcysteine synthetase [Punctularia strigosozonata HHB-11173 SS5]EIN03487.1 gamma glutamylcysteine synthetase [Punctularia strigosozonata HHB-11173 SS5]
MWQMLRGDLLDFLLFGLICSYVLLCAVKGPKVALSAWIVQEDAKKHSDAIRRHALNQFLRIRREEKDRDSDPFRWGDEVFECMIVALDHEHRTAQRSLRQDEVPSNIHATEKARREPGRHILETTPSDPGTSTIHDLRKVEPNVRQRLVTLTSFPLMGAPGAIREPLQSKASMGMFVPENVLSGEARYQAAASNIRARRAAKPAINVPVFIDKNTARAFTDGMLPEDRVAPEPDSDCFPEPDHIYLDVMAFGISCCCLQVTMQAANLSDARRLYDMLTPVAPIMMALTAASPIWRGYLTDVDCRWDVIAALCDDRTPEERGMARIPKSRYESVSLYLADEPPIRPEYNDVHAPLNQPVYEELVQHRVDEPMARHVAHQFVRDSVIAYRETLDQDDAIDSEHFDDVQACNWQSMRLKVPESETLGWRVELRTMEVQPTDYGNAAMTVFVVLLSRAILRYNLSFYIRMSKVDDNMKRAQRRDAARRSKFWFRKHDREMRNSFPRVLCPDCPNSADDGLEEMTMDEIVNGKGDAYLGLVGLVDLYFDSLEMDQSTLDKLRDYVALVRGRADETWMRKFVENHPAYQFDSIVHSDIAYDLIVAVWDLEQGLRKEACLVPATRASAADA